MSVTEAEVTNRWGRVELRTERLDDTYTRCTFVGSPDAVIAAVANQQGGITQQYEHMLRVKSVVSRTNGDLCIVTVRSNYAGD